MCIRDSLDHQRVVSVMAAKLCSSAAAVRPPPRTGIIEDFFDDDGLKMAKPDMSAFGMLRSQSSSAIAGWRLVQLGRSSDQHSSSRRHTAPISAP